MARKDLYKIVCEAGNAKVSAFFSTDIEKYTQAPAMAGGVKLLVSSSFGSNLKIKVKHIHELVDLRDAINQFLDEIGYEGSK